MIKRNPKQKGSNLWDCKPQIGLCPNNCNQCFYNRPGAFYLPIDEPIIPDPDEVGDGIVRMNCGHDSNIGRSKVVKTAQRYKYYFFNTSIPEFDFPGPVVFTANPREEDFCWMPEDIAFDFRQLMFVRLRVSASNLPLIRVAVKKWALEWHIPVVLTFMAYYEEDVVKKVFVESCVSNQKLLDCMSCNTGKACFEHYYVYKQRHVNSYWCPTSEFMSFVIDDMEPYGGRNVYMCGLVSSTWCKDCKNCESFYWQTLKRIRREK